MDNCHIMCLNLNRPIVRICHPIRIWLPHLIAPFRLLLELFDASLHALGKRCRWHWTLAVCSTTGSLPSAALETLPSAAAVSCGRSACVIFERAAPTQLLRLPLVPLPTTLEVEGWEMCMNVASMSTFIQHRDGRNHYKCMTCKQKECADSAPVSDSVPLRVLDLHILVRDGNKTTFMRNKAYRLCLCAPPPQWAWGYELRPAPPSDSGHA